MDKQNSSLEVRQIPFKEIAALAQSRCRNLIPTILPEGVEKSGEWISRNPRRNDKSLGSFKFNLNTGLWADFATGDCGGDIISLIAYLDQSSQLNAARKLMKIMGDRI
ncbi:MAG: hypothetical protein NT027_15140 [Proteobacteria bacterium]|nr:hypothetical protein [Pseudomonadota bacterium]